MNRENGYKELLECLRDRFYNDDNHMNADFIWWFSDDVLTDINYRLLYQVNDSALALYACNSGDFAVTGTTHDELTDIRNFFIRLRSYRNRGR